MAKWSDKALGAMRSAATQPWGSVAGKAIDTWDTCQHCNCRDGYLHHPNCPTQLRLREDNPADEPWGSGSDQWSVHKGCEYCNAKDEDTCPDCGEEICNCWLDDVDEGTEEFRSVFVKPEYSDLFEVLREALEEAQEGKGAVRHGNGLSFMEQPALTITRAVGIGFPLGQAMKKIQESQRMDTDAAKRELLGAINYLAAAILSLEK